MRLSTARIVAALAVVFMLTGCEPDTVPSPTPGAEVVVGKGETVATTTSRSEVAAGSVIAPPSDRLAPSRTVALEMIHANGALQGCSGALIGSATVLTAGHCLFSPKSGSPLDRFVALVGAAQLSPTALSSTLMDRNNDGVEEYENLYAYRCEGTAALSHFDPSAPRVEQTEWDYAALELSSCVDGITGAELAPTEMVARVGVLDLCAVQPGVAESHTYPGYLQLGQESDNPDEWSSVMLRESYDISDIAERGVTMRVGGSVTYKGSSGGAVVQSQQGAQCIVGVVIRSSLKSAEQAAEMYHYRTAADGFAVVRLWDDQMLRDIRDWSGA